MQTKTIVGVDIAKEKFYAAILRDSKIVLTKEFTNDTKGFKELKKLIEQDDAYLVMEATGPYYLNLAYFFYSSGYKITVLNPIIIRRFIQMQMKRAKTDKADAIQIAMYAEKHDVDLWQPKNETLEQARQILTRLDLIERQLTASRNQLEAMQNHYLKTELVLKSIHKTILFLENEIEELEQQLMLLMNKEYKNEMRNLMTIPGIGKKTALFLIIVTNNFTKFDNAKQLISYIGTSPRIFESGKTVKAKAHITKMGLAKVRRSLYMCTYTAQIYNPACHELKNSLQKKGKPSRVIKIAILNKLLRQAFAIGKNNTQFNINYLNKKIQ